MRGLHHFVLLLAAIVLGLAIFGYGLYRGGKAGFFRPIGKLAVGLAVAAVVMILVAVQMLW